MEVFSFEGNYQNKPFRAFYAIADPGSGNLQIEHDTTKNRRITPSGFYEKNRQPVLVVNTSFFSFKDNLNLNIIVNKGKLLAFNNHTIPGRGADSGLYYHPFVSALGINKKGEMDVAWTFTARNKRKPFVTDAVFELYMDSIPTFSLQTARNTSRLNGRHTAVAKHRLVKWKKETVIGGGPVLVQNNLVAITNNEEWKFAGKAIQDAHPRTAIGYTKEGKLIVLVIEGRNPGIAAGATLEETASILVELGCVEALNLDGGGSSCMLINGKETIRPSDKEGQREVPAAMIMREGR
ncbi:phosphodiester glycosidase family protein [Flavihumibacter sp. UBA7668]|uniref:phosphodiester glycosidase family protein n=1 Tax=Flavihumibacter sp. UBA7668 TaxID=1946542 RepID=UPI0025BE7DA4|nr:phosphodiester glycosidase family protein [Flavihumibacter sp. UBA7668]